MLLNWTPNVQWACFKEWLIPSFRNVALEVLDIDHSKWTCIIFLVKHVHAFNKGFEYFRAWNSWFYLEVGDSIRAIALLDKRAFANYRSVLPAVNVSIINQEIYNYNVVVLQRFCFFSLDQSYLMLNTLHSSALRWDNCLELVTSCLPVPHTIP
jgi:hypothetical protein